MRLIYALSYLPEVNIKSSKYSRNVEGIVVLIQHLIKY